ncbi:zona occludens toxin [Cupriavidus sp. YR651]|uniref:zonular occludens toxin domain-containing protein n=1 Tax=Cupriavidus sp. YR651 TaxID=1855315 RepID=UPI0008861759|nr:zonular occludens toxin domain-containing protein [Cupriavidus sp. YR651]SDC52300.1 zona occludens toxin [Cupriavidus sp. YR651]
MINLLLGAPGGGKSYEAVAYHVIPALASGRKVITNLPLVLDQFPPEQRALLEIRSHALGKPEARRGAFGLVDDADSEVYRRPFSTGECYGDTWRHPDNGAGPLYVIDEVHMCLPREGTQRKVREWYSMHRHELADVLLITQSHGKVCKDIVDLVQVCYRVRKATAFGSNNGYIRKVVDGVRGDVVNTGVRKYDSKYFRFYRSHTKTSQAGAELTANDIVPLWRRWPFIGFGICMVLLVVILTTSKSVNPLKGAPRDKPLAAQRNATASPGVVPAVAPASAPGARAGNEHAPGDGQSARNGQVSGHPFAGLGIHVTGIATMHGRMVVALVMSQNGQRVFVSNSEQMQEAGYKVTRLNDCAVKFKYDQVELVALCDAPQVAAVPADGVMNQKPVPQASEG